MPVRAVSYAVISMQCPLEISAGADVALASMLCAYRENQNFYRFSSQMAHQAPFKAYDSKARKYA